MEGKGRTRDRQKPTVRTTRNLQSRYFRLAFAKRPRFDGLSDQSDPVPVSDVAEA